VRRNNPWPTQVKLKDPGAFTIVGNQKLPRLDARAKSTGKQQFAIDVMLPGMMTAVVMRPPRFGAKVSSFDASKAKAVPGVVDVVQIPRGVAVVGRDMWSAKKGREALSVTWDESGAEKRGTAELMKEYRTLGRGKEAVTVVQVGDVEAALAHATKRLEGEFEFPYLAHAPMEPLTAVCSLSADKCEIWAGCQFQTLDQANAAAAVGLKPEQVTINTLAAGGTFGRRATPESDYISEVASIAKATGGKYPVRLIWTREDDITGGRYRPLNYHRITAAVGKDGKVAFRQRVVGQSILIGTPFEAMMVKNGVDPTAAGGSAAEQYNLADAQISWSQPKVGVPVLWWRSVENTHMAFSKEVMIDELAHVAGQDPVTFRLALLGKHPRHVGALKLAAEKAGWDSPFSKDKGRGRGVAVHESFGSVVAQVAEVTVSGDKITVDRVGVRGRLRHRGHARHHQGTDAKRHRLRVVGGAVRQDHPHRRSRRSDQLPPVPGAAHQRHAAGDRGVHRALDQCAFRCRGTGNSPDRTGGGQRGARSNRDPAAHAAV